METVHKLHEYDPQKHNGFNYVEYNLTQSYETFEERLTLINSWADKLKAISEQAESLFIMQVRSILMIDSSRVSDINFVRIYRIYIKSGGKDEA